MTPLEIMANAKYPLELFLRVITVSLETRLTDIAAGRHVNMEQALNE